MPMQTLPTRLYGLGVRADDCEVVTNRRGTAWIVRCGGSVVASGSLFECLGVLRGLRREAVRAGGRA